MCKHQSFSQNSVNNPIRLQFFLRQLKWGLKKEHEKDIENKCNACFSKAKVFSIVILIEYHHLIPRYYRQP